MKTINVSMQQNQKLLTPVVNQIFPAIATSLRSVLALIAAVLVATAVITLSVWVAGVEIGVYLGAASWGLGFIFLGLAVDNRGSAAFFQMVTGLALLVLALLQSKLSSDYIIVSGVLVAAWIGVLLFNRLSD